jgi:hypothetical protein
MAVNPYQASATTTLRRDPGFRPATPSTWTGTGTISQL